jgi:hypothetical protein
MAGKGFPWGRAVLALMTVAAVVLAVLFVLKFLKVF